MNPAIGCAKVEIWRLAILWVYGGFYMDDDAVLGTKLDDIVQPNDRFIIAKEPGTPTLILPSFYSLRTFVPLISSQLS